MRAVKPIGLILLSIGIALLLGTGASFARTRAFLGKSLVAKGEIVGFALAAAPDGGAYDGRFAIIRFRDARGEAFEVVASTSVAKDAAPGDAADMRYAPGNPAAAKVDSFGDIWAETLVLAGMGAVFSALGGLLTWYAFREGFLEKRALGYSREIKARITSVAQDVSTSLNGISPYRITAQWLNPETHAVHVFTSKNIWFDPGAFIGEEVLIKADARNLKYYWMDVSFLPKLTA